MKLVFFDFNKAMTDAWLDALKRAKLDDVQVYLGPLGNMLDHVRPMIVSTAGNSLGIMGAGIDGALAKTFPEVKPRARELVRQHWLGEMPVGARSLVVPNNGGPLIAYTPTMPWPGTKLKDSHGVYMAMRGLLLATVDFGDSRVLAIPGMGTGIGGLAHEDAAEAQIRAVAELREQGLHA